MPAEGDKQLGKLIHRVVIGHAGNIIADGALHAVKGQLGQVPRPLCSDWLVLRVEGRFL